MRDPDRLYQFYSQLCEIHRASFPDMRFGQFVLNAITWIGNITRRDSFFIEENEMLELFKEYANAESMWYREWEAKKKQ